MYPYQISFGMLTLGFFNHFPRVLALGKQVDFSSAGSLEDKLWLTKLVGVPKQTLLQNRPLFLAICLGSLWARDNRWLLSQVQRLAGPAGGRGPFVPV